MATPPAATFWCHCQKFAEFRSLWVRYGAGGGVMMSVVSKRRTRTPINVALRARPPRPHFCADGVTDRKILRGMCSPYCEAKAIYSPSSSGPSSTIWSIGSGRTWQCEHAHSRYRRHRLHWAGANTTPSVLGHDIACAIRRPDTLILGYAQFQSATLERSQTGELRCKG
jgi:hypothetical protein